MTETVRTAAPAPAVTAPRSAAPRRGGRIARNLATITMVWQREMIRFFRMPSRIITGLAQPLIFLFILGAGLDPLVGDRTAGGIDYQEFIFPGVIAMSILFSSLFSAISIVWDREFGFLREMLVAPVSRVGLVLGKAVGGGSIAVVQGLILLIAAPLIGVTLNPLEFVEMFGLLLLLAFSLNAFGIVIASRMQRMEGFQMVMTLVVNPMLFLSGAIFPTEGLPTWLEVLTRLNPVTYGVDPIRRVMLGSDASPLTWGGWVVPIWLEVLIVLTLGTAMLAIAVHRFRQTE
jgi:ABC-2 type transport system permease protein